MQTNLVTGITLASFADGKQISTAVAFVLQGNNGSWATIPGDQYDVARANGRVLKRLYDDSDNAVDWSAYTSYRATYALYDPTTQITTTYTNETQTYGEFDFFPAVFDPSTGKVNATLLDGLVVTAQQFADSIGSDNFSSGVSGWQVTRAGNAEFNDITARGTIIASAGSIGGWTINSTYLAKDTGVDATSAGMSPSDYPFYAGATYANRTTAPFRVTPAGAATASSIDLAGGSVSGTFTVSGTLRSAASPNARYELTGTGLKGYDSGNVQRYQILNDGSGWLGSSSVFSWTTAGVVSLNGSAVVGNSLDADKVTFTAPTLSGLTLTNNSPSAGYVAWSSFKLTYQGVSYTVASGNSNNKYIYWKKSVSTTVLQTSATIPANAPDMFIVCVNFSGTAYQSNFAPFVYADYISVGNLAAISAAMGTLTSGTIVGSRIATSDTGARTELHYNNLFGLGFGGIGGTDGTTTQWYAKASDGKFYAGGGNLIIGSAGIEFTSGAGASNAIKWTSGGSTYSQIYTTTGAATSWLFALDPNALTSELQWDFKLRGTGVVPSLHMGYSSGAASMDLYGFNTLTWERSTTGGTIDLIGLYDTANSDTTVGNTAAETTLYSKSISANDLSTTSGIRVRVFGVWTNNTGANRTLTVRIKFGATTLVSPTMTLTTSGTNGHFDIAIHLFNTTASAQMGMSQVEFRRGSAIIDGAWNSTLTAAENTTSAKTFTVTVQWDTANANATLTKTIAYIELLQ